MNIPPERLSPDAQAYFKSLRRHNIFAVENRNSIQAYMQSQGIPPFEKIIDFQIEFSGLELVLDGKQSTFTVELFSESDIISNRIIDPYYVNGHYFFLFGDHETAQFWFVLGENGEIGTYDSNDDSVNIFYSSFDKFIEDYALKSRLIQEGKYECPCHYNLIHLDMFNKLTHDFIQHNHSSDQYNKWLSKEDMVINLGTWYDQPSFYIQVYADSQVKCDNFISLLKSKSIIE